MPQQSPWIALFSWKICKNIFAIWLTKNNFVKHIENIPQHLSAIRYRYRFRKLRFINYRYRQEFFEAIDYYRYRFSTKGFIVPITGNDVVVARNLK